MPTGGPGQISDEDLAELARIAASTRALLEWHEACGGETVALADPAGVLAALEPPSARPRSAPEAGRVRPPSSTEPFQPTPLAPPARRPETAPGPASPPAATPPIAPPAPLLSPEDRVRHLEVMQREVQACLRCPLSASRTKTAFSRGSPSAELCFVGEGPGADEDREGVPFVGKAGQLLDRMIAAMGYARDDVYICNIVKCRPPNNRKPELIEMQACASYLESQLEIVRPKVIVALGATAVQGLLGTSEGITRLRGKWKLYKGTIPIMPTFHPAYLLRQPGAKREVWSDLLEALRQLGRTAPGRG